MKNGPAAALGIGAAALVVLAALLSERPAAPTNSTRRPAHAAVLPPDSPEVLSLRSDLGRLRTLRSARPIPLSGVGEPEYQASLERLRAAAPRALHYLEELVLDRGEDPALRVDLLNLVAAERGEPTRLFLASIAGDGSEPETLRIAAIEALMAYRDPATFEVIRAAYLDPAPFGGRYHLCRALGRSGRPEAVPLLKDALAPAQALELRCHAAEGLGEYPLDRDARAELQRAALSDASPRVRQEAVRALARSPEAEKILVDLLLRDLDPETRALADELRKAR